MQIEKSKLLTFSEVIEKTPKGKETLFLVVVKYKDYGINEKNEQVIITQESFIQSLYFSESVLGKKVVISWGHYIGDDPEGFDEEDSTDYQKYVFVKIEDKKAQEISSMLRSTDEVGLFDESLLSVMLGGE